MTTPDGGPTAADDPGAAAPEPSERPDPVRDVRSDDDRDVGWGDDLDRSGRADHADPDARDARWYEEQRPPHWE